MSRLLQSAGLIIALSTALGSICTQPASADMPRKIYIHRALLDIYEKTNRASDAMGEYRALLQLAPGDAGIQYGFGTLLYKQKEFNLAANYLKKAANLDPSHPEYWSLLGDAYLQSHQYKAAIDAYMHAGPNAKDKLDRARQYMDQLREQENYNRALRQREEQ